MEGTSAQNNLPEQLTGLSPQAPFIAAGGRWASLCPLSEFPAGPEAGALD